MTLLGRLQRVVGMAPTPEPSRGRAGEPIAHALTRLRGALDRHAAAEPRERIITSGDLREDLDTALPGGHVVPTAHGPTWAVDTVIPADLRHGDMLIGQALETSYDHLELLTGDRRLHGFDPRDALFLDIEATGLEHGAGTIAFMIGLGFVDATGFRVRQLVLREPDEERALLACLWDALDRHRFLVSFNGKSFDLSVLQARLVMQRFCSARESELKLRPHFDLLHVSRALYKKVWTDVRLQTLERRVLGFVREDDMPGSMAPLCWFQWLREADARPLAGIARHNHFDVLSMVALAGAIADVARPVGDAGRRTALALNLARLYARRRFPAEALTVLEALGPMADPGERRAAHELAATCARRVGDDAAQARHLGAWLALDPAADGARRALERIERRRARVAQTRQRA